MRKSVIAATLAAGFIAATAALGTAAVTLPGCAAVNPGAATCTFTIKAGNVPAGVVATTTWQVKNSAGKLVYAGGPGKTTIAFPAGVYKLTAVGKGFAGAGKA